MSILWEAKLVQNDICETNALLSSLRLLSQKRDKAILHPIVVVVHKYSLCGLRFLNFNNFLKLSRIFTKLG